MPLSSSPVSGLVFKPKGFIQQSISDLVAADIILIPGANYVTVFSDQNMFLGFDRDALEPEGAVEDDLLYLPAGASRTIYIGGVSRISAIATIAGTLFMQEVIGA